jgi:hypothetical protein
MELEIRKHGDIGVKTWRNGDMMTRRQRTRWRHGDMETWRHGYIKTWIHEDMETWR